MNLCQTTVETANKEGLYVYCVARAWGNCPLGRIGLDDNLVYAVPSGDICAVVHSGKPEPYQADDPQTVQGWVFAHQRVIQTAMEAFGTVLPMAFNMIVHENLDNGAIENLQAWLAENRDRFTRLLDKLNGKAEYGVQVFWDRKVVAETIVKSDPELYKIRDEARDKPKGLAYMLQQKLAKATRAALERQANRYVEDFYTRIRQCVDEVQVDTLKKVDPPAVDKQMLLNLSCLMTRGDPALGAVLEEIQKTEGISVRFTGPWPPYSFVGGGRMKDLQIGNNNGTGTAPRT